MAAVAGSTVALLTGVAAYGVGTGPLTGDLDDRHDRVEQRVDQAEGELDESSAELRAATAALTGAQARLDAAEETLARTRGQVTAAQILDRQMQAALDAAERRLADARERLAEAREDIRDQRRQLASLAAQTYQSGSSQLMGLTAVFASDDPGSLTSNLNVAHSLLDREMVGLDRLTASEVITEVTEAKVAEMKAEVAAKRAQAAANLARKLELEAQAVREAERVASLVAAHEAARAEAERLKQRDLRVLREIERERSRIEQLLRARAERNRRAAALEASRSAGGYLSHPVDGYVTSSYGWRTHPIYGYRSFHDGVDYGAGRCGAPIRAAADGTVVSGYYQTAYGNRLIVDHGWIGGGGLATIYNHASGYTVGVGARVERGQVIGYIGSTGWSTGCHLHFTVLRNGVASDPSGWL